ncbi:NfeD family protein [bacterium]|nr:NfeD family protein [bacterium]
MKLELWWIWMVFAAVFVIGEMFTAGFFLLWFGIGAAVAGILALAGLGAGWQWAAFIVISGILFGVSRKFAEKFTRKQPPGIGADRFLGKKGLVLKDIDNLQNKGQVRLDKEEWRAESEDGQIIKAGDIVEIIKVDGTHLVVKPISKGD